VVVAVRDAGFEAESEAPVLQRMEIRPRWVLDWVPGIDQAIELAADRPARPGPSP
jgi:hypothetical protein